MQQATHSSTAKVANDATCHKQYDYKVKYIPGKDVGLAYALSRLPNLKTNDNMDMDMKVEML